MWLLAFKLKAWFLYNVYEIHMCNRDDELSGLEVWGSSFEMPKLDVLKCFSN